MDSAVQHVLRALESRVEEVVLNNSAASNSLQSKVSALDEQLRYAEADFHKHMREQNDETLNRIREITTASANDRNALERRMMMAESALSSLAERGDTTTELIDSYFASSKDIKRFEAVSLSSLSSLFACMMSMMMNTMMMTGLRVDDDDDDNKHDDNHNAHHNNEHDHDHEHDVNYHDDVDDHDDVMMWLTYVHICR